MDVSQFSELIARGREQRGVEFKGPGSRKSDKHLVAKIVRACLSMANNRDGGIVIVGVDEDSNDVLALTGLTENQLKTWKHDELADTLATYADPSISFEVTQLSYQGRSFVAIEVEEFEDIPVLCKRDYPDVLRSGACYVRTRRKPETAEVPTQEDMRDLLELAVEKGVRRFMTIAHSAGVTMNSEGPPTHENLFNQQVEDFLGASK